MSRDKLAAFRSQQQRSSTANQSPTLNTNSYELRNVDAHHDSSGNGEMASFYADLQIIQSDLDAYRDYVSRISELHSRSMNITDTGGVEQDKIQLNDLVKKSRTLSNEIKKKIEHLQKEKQTGTEGRIRNQQALLLTVVSRKFVEAIQSYQQVEQQYRSKYKQRVERQFKIGTHLSRSRDSGINNNPLVKPDASPEEIKAVVDESGGEQIFAQALQSTTRYGAARAAYQEVQERQADIKKIEHTLGELAQLFNDMSLLIDQQSEVIDEIEQRADTVAVDAEQGLKQTDRAVKSARSARRKRWICFFLTLIILAALGIALGIGLGVGIPKHNS